MIMCLEFELPREEEDLRVTEKAFDLYFTLCDLDEWLRGRIKYDNREELQPVRDKLYELMDKRKVSLDILS